MKKILLILTLLSFQLSAFNSARAQLTIPGTSVTFRLNNEDWRYLRTFELPEGGEFTGEIENDLSGLDLKECAEKISNAIFSAEQGEGCSINALEIFVYRDTVRVRNSNGVDKTQRITRAFRSSCPPKRSITPSWG